MATDVFGPALAQMPPGRWSLFGPRSFQDYLREHGLPRVDTAQHISVDAAERLAPTLREAQAMVLRLGAAQDGRGTQFALVGTPGHLNDFFLVDEPATGPPQRYQPKDTRPLYPYSVFPWLTETSTVNLGFASGLFGHALGLDPPYPTAAPATGSSTYTFSFRPHTAMDQVLEHHRGQVEIDAVFTGRRDGQDCLFIIEAKTRGREHTLAKHKLVYPVLALAPSVPHGMPIIPVYVRTQVTRQQVRYRVVECSFPDPRRRVTALDELQPTRRLSLVLDVGAHQ